MSTNNLTSGSSECSQERSAQETCPTPPRAISCPGTWSLSKVLKNKGISWRAGGGQLRRGCRAPCSTHTHTHTTHHTHAGTHTDTYTHAETHTCKHTHACTHTAHTPHTHMHTHVRRYAQVSMHQAYKCTHKHKAHTRVHRTRTCTTHTNTHPRRQVHTHLHSHDGTTHTCAQVLR